MLSCHPWENAAVRKLYSSQKLTDIFANGSRYKVWSFQLQVATFYSPQYRCIESYLVKVLAC